jgi:hypothetical protein
MVVCPRLHDLEHPRRPHPPCGGRRRGARPGQPRGRVRTLPSQEDRPRGTSGPAPEATPIVNWVPRRASVSATAMEVGHEAGHDPGRTGTGASPHRPHRPRGVDPSGTIGRRRRRASGSAGTQPYARGRFRATSLARHPGRNLGANSRTSNAHESPDAGVGTNLRVLDLALAYLDSIQQGEPPAERAGVDRGRVGVSLARTSGSLVGPGGP